MSALGQKRTHAVQQGMSALPPIATSIAFSGISGGHLTFDNERDLKGVHSAVLVSPIRGGANAVHRNYEDHFGGGRSRRSSYWHRFAARFLSRDQSAGSRGRAGQRHNMVADQIQDRTHRRTACQYGCNRPAHQSSEEINVTEFVRLGLL